MKCIRVCYGGFAIWTATFWACSCLSSANNSLQTWHGMCRRLVIVALQFGLPSSGHAPASAQPEDQSNMDNLGLSLPISANRTPCVQGLAVVALQSGLSCCGHAYNSAQPANQCKNDAVGVRASCCSFAVCVIPDTWAISSCSWQVNAKVSSTASDLLSGFHVALQPGLLTCGGYSKCSELNVHT